MVIYYTYHADYAGTHEYPMVFALTIAAVLIMSTFFGRVYYGVHTFIDTIGGFIMALVIFGLYTRFVLDDDMMMMMMI